MTQIPSQTGSYRIGMFDADTVDVYRDTNAVIFLINPTNRETFEYVIAKCAIVPKKIAILLILNFRSVCNFQIITIRKYFSQSFF